MSELVNLLQMLSGAIPLKIIRITKFDEKVPYLSELLPY